MCVAWNRYATCGQAHVCPNPANRGRSSCGRMGASPIGAARIRVEVFRPEIRIREKDRKISEPLRRIRPRGVFHFLVDPAGSWKPEH
jgi:hypothetical protein